MKSATAIQRWNCKY